VDELEERHQALVERDRRIGLEAEADAARAHAARLEAKLAVAQQRLDRKNERIRQLSARVKVLEDAAPGFGLGTRLTRAVRRR
jgi:chromosome segregation ATPase